MLAVLVEGQVTIVYMVGSRPPGLGSSRKQYSSSSTIFIILSVQLFVEYPVVAVNCHYLALQQPLFITAKPPHGVLPCSLAPLGYGL